MALFGTEVFDPCEVEWRRQQTFHGFESKHFSRKSKSAMPIVELRPFTQKEWCRENSLPNTNGQDNNSDSMDKPFYGIDPLDMIQTKIPSNSSRVHIINLSDQIMQKPSKLPTHPPVEPRPYQRNDHRHGFTTLGDRTKTTLDEIKKGTSPNKSHSCLKQALTPGDIAKIQEIRLYGAQMRKIIERKRFQYLDPWSQYRHTESMKMANDPVDNQKLQDWKQLHFGTVGDPGVGLSSNTTVFDTFDLAGTLPSIQIKHAAVKPSKARRMNRQKSGGSKSAHTRRRIGGIKNSFQILNEVGPPVNIERQLTMELEINLKHVRRNKDFTLASNSSTPRQFQHVIYRGRPTAGERQLQKGLESNSVKSNRLSLDSESVQKLSSRPATIAKTDGRDSGIQSPAGSDDDFVSFQKEDRPTAEGDLEPQEPLTSEAEVVGQTTTESRTETSNMSFANGQENGRVRPKSASSVELLRGSSRIKSVGSVSAVMDMPTVTTSMSERGSAGDAVFLEAENAMPKPLLQLPEISPSSSALV